MTDRNYRVTYADGSVQEYYGVSIAVSDYLRELGIYEVAPGKPDIFKIMELERQIVQRLELSGTAPNGNVVSVKKISNG